MTGQGCLSIMAFMALEKACLKIIIAALLCLQAALYAPQGQAQTPAQQKEAAQNWEICNETSFSLRVATATGQSGKIISQGWDRIRAGSCISRKSDPNAARFVFAESAPAHWGGIREWNGPVNLCAADEDFTADNTVNCAFQDMGVRGFLAIAPDEPVTTFVEAADYGSNATTAGIQRLLRDNGYPISRIDGVAGKRTLRTLSTYLKDNQFSQTLSVEDQLDRLETTALKKIKTIGLTLCNQSTAKIWTAIGYRRRGQWESRGWWAIEADSCLQPYTNTLEGAELYYYAQQENNDTQDHSAEESAGETVNAQSDKTLRTASAQPNQFCIAESRFSALGRENCIDNGYRAANFRAVPSDKDGMTISLTDADFAPTSATGSAIGLRR